MLASRVCFKAVLLKGINRNALVTGIMLEIIPNACHDPPFCPLSSLHIISECSTRMGINIIYYFFYVS